MATSPVCEILQHLRRAALTDAQLLEAYISRRDQAALTDLVKRHAPMVWGVCRRILRDYHDAEDAFQATFLVLVRRAASITSRDLLANWLYGVAHQTALKARATAAKRKGREKQVTEMPEAAVAAGDQWSDLRALLDAEVNCLPAKYRVVVVLCDLEGKTRKEAARQLRLPEGTIASRLARARVMLAKRFTRRGLAVSAGALAAVLSQDLTAGCVPVAVLSSARPISTQVAALTEGVLKAMFWTTLKKASVTVLVMALLGLAGGVFVWRSQAAEQPTQQASGKNEDLKKRLLELDELWWKGGVDTFRKLAADDLVTVSGVGRYDKASLLEAAKNRHQVDWVKRDVEVISVSRDVAIVTYLYDSKVVLSDGTLLENRRDRRLSMTWANRKGHWVVVFAQETILPGGE